MKRRIIGNRGDGPILSMYDLLLIDMNNLAWRVIRSLGEKGIEDDEVPGAYNNILRSLYKLFRMVYPKQVLLCWDSGPYWRSNIFSDYKAKRAPVTEEFFNTLHRIEELLDLFNLPQAKTSGFEADDWIAWGRAVSEKPTLIVSTDRDLFQLVTDGKSFDGPWWGYPGEKEKEKEHPVHIYYPKGARVSTNDFTIVNQSTSKEMFVNPHLVTTFKSIVGDSSDNIPGVKGIGKTKGKLVIEHHGHILSWLLGDNPYKKDVLFNANGPEAMLNKITKMIIENEENVELFYSIIDLSEDWSPENYDLFSGRKFRSGSQNWEKIESWFYERGMDGTLDLAEDLLTITDGIKACPGRTEEEE